MDSDASVYYCALSRVFAYQCAAGRHLLEAFGSPAAVFSASRDELSAVLIHAGSFIDRLLDPALLPWARREAEWAASLIMAPECAIRPAASFSSVRITFVAMLITETLVAAVWNAS